MKSQTTTLRKAHQHVCGCGGGERGTKTHLKPLNLIKLCGRSVTIVFTFIMFFALQTQDPLIQKQPGRGFVLCFLISHAIGSALLNVLNTDRLAMAAGAWAGGGGRAVGPQGISLGRASSTLPWGVQEGVYVFCPIHTDSSVHKRSYRVKCGPDHSLAVSTGNYFASMSLSISFVQWASFPPPPC